MPDHHTADSGEAHHIDTAISEPETNPDPEDTGCDLVYEPYPFIEEVVSYEPGEGAGFGQDQYPDIVYGPPLGAGENAGSLDVLSLGEGGTIVLSFRSIDIIDEENM